MVEILPLERAPSAEVEALLDTVFGNDRHARTAYRLRDGVSWLPALSFAAFDGDDLVGTLQSWPVVLASGGREYPMTLVGPVAVLPHLQRSGIGKRLMNALIEAAPRHGHDALVMIGDPEYYDHFFGFSNRKTGGWDLPGPFERRRLLARIATAGSLPANGMIGPDLRRGEKPIAA